MRTRSICLAIAILVLCQFASAQWQQIGPYIGPATCFATSGQEVFAGVPGAGVLISTDNGTTWTTTNTGLTDSTVLALVISGSKVFAGTAGGGVFRSTNNGTSWTAVNQGVPRDRYDSTRYDQIRSFAASGQNLFTGTLNRGVLLSTNNGTSWTEVTEGLPREGSDSTRYVGISGIVALGQNIFAGTYVGVFLSTNNGATWSAVNNGLTNGNVQSLCVSGTSLLAGTYDGGIFLSSDSATHWSPVNGGLPRSRYDSTRYAPIEFLASYGQSLFAATCDGVYRSTNNGTDWNGLMGSAVSALGVSGTNIYAGTFFGISVSPDNGSSWTLRSRGGGPYAGIWSLAARGTELYAGTAWGVGARKVGFDKVEAYLFHSTDNGESWMPQLEADVSAIVIRDADVFVGTSWVEPGAGVFRSTDHGTSWTAVNQGLPKALWGYGDTSGYAHIGCFVSNGQVLFAGTYGSGLFRSTNDGSSWAAVNTGIPCHSFWDLASCGTNILAATDAGVIRSTNNGTSWSAANTGGILSFAVIGTTVFAGGYNGVILSTDSGTSWTEVGMEFRSLVLELAAVGNNLLVETMYDGAFLSTDSGMNWRSISSGGDGDIVANDTYAFWGSNGGMWPGGGGLRRRSLSEIITSADPGTSASPREFVLQQNYPNPFNPKTVISCQWPVVSDVRLVVYDILGREVALLVNERKMPGRYEVEFDASGLASGVYFYRLTAGKYVECRKMVLMK